MTLRERIKETLTWRIAAETGCTLATSDLCRDLMPGWDSADAAPREKLRRDVGVILFKLVRSGELVREAKGVFRLPPRHWIYRQPLARVPDVVRLDAERRSAA